MKKERGFTLVELLLSVVIIGLLVGLSLPIYQTFQVRNDLEVASESIADMLRRAQTYSRGVNGDSQWGVRVQNGSAVLFKGSSYAGRDAAYDETTSFSSSYSVSGLSDVIFSKLSAAPSANGTITLANADTNDTRTVTINAKGMVSN